MKVKLTSKRQATFPVSICRELGLHPGDEIELEPHLEENRRYWTLRKSAAPAPSWLGILRAYAGNGLERHDLASIRDRVSTARQGEAGR